MSQPKRDKSDFQQSFEKAYREGGLFVYGMEPARDKLRNDADWVGGVPKSFRKDSSGATTEYTTVDVVNNETWRGPQAMSMFASTARPDDIPGIMKAHRAVATSKRNSTDRKLSQRYSEGLLSHRTYDPRETAKADAKLLQAKELKDMPDAAKFRSQTIKACKFGIDFAAEEKRTVLFVLDGLEEKSTVGKQPITKTNTEAMRRHAAKQKRIGEENWQKIPERQNQRSITGAELRKAFRRDVSDEGLQFFEGHKRVSAPWVRDEGYPAWRDYLGHRLTRYQNWAKSQAATSPKWEGTGSFMDLKIPSGRLTRQGFREINQRINAAKKHFGTPPPKLRSNL